MKIFWFFFSKKNRLRAGLAGGRAHKKDKRFFLKKEAKTFNLIHAETPNES
jgi:hypothetical protein